MANSAVYTGGLRYFLVLWGIYICPVLPLPPSPTSGAQQSTDSRAPAEHQQSTSRAQSTAEHSTSTNSTPEHSTSNTTSTGSTSNTTKSTPPNSTERVFLNTTYPPSFCLLMSQVSRNKQLKLCIEEVLSVLQPRRTHTEPLVHPRYLCLYTGTTPTRCF